MSQVRRSLSPTQKLTSPTKAPSVEVSRALSVTDQQTPTKQSTAPQATGRVHNAWNRLVGTLSSEMNEEELSKLTLDTVKALAVHYAVASNPLDTAHIELAWKEKQLAHQKAEAEAAAKLLQQQQQAQQVHVDPMATDKSTARKPIRSSTKLPVSLLPRKPTVVVPAKDAKETKKRSITSPPPAEKKADVKAKTDSTKTATPTRTPSSPPPTKQESVQEAPKESPTVFLEGIRKQEQQSKYGEVICVEDVKETFQFFAQTAGGNKFEMDQPRFLKLCKECDLIDKLFTTRECEAAFQKSKIVHGDRRIPYHQFRLKLVPEVASKKRCSIAEVVKAINRRGVPEEVKQKKVTPKKVPVPRKA